MKLIIKWAMIPLMAAVLVALAIRYDIRAMFGCMLCIAMQAVHGGIMRDEEDEELMEETIDMMHELISEMTEENEDKE